MELEDFKKHLLAKEQIDNLKQIKVSILSMDKSIDFLKGSNPMITT